MATVVDIVLMADRYDAGAGQDPRQTEWPPHPARVFSALRAVADDEDDLGTLRRLEVAPPPIVHAGVLVSQARSRAYVVTNTVVGGGGNLTHLGRTSGLRERRSVFPDSPRVQMVWPDDVGSGDLAVLDRMARRVPYLGRSTSVVLMGARRVDDPPPPPGLKTWTPCDPAVADTWLRSPYPGYIDELGALFAAGLSAWQASEGGRASRPYCSDAAGAGDADRVLATAFASSPYRDLVVLRFEEQRPAGRLVALYTAALRSLVMKRTSEPVPLAVHGHGLDGLPHVAYLGLPAAGFPHADGHLVGLGVAIPGMEEAERRRVLRGILGTTEDEVLQLDVPGQKRPVALRYRPAEPRPLAATARYWTRPSKRWVSVTPVVLDRYPKRGDLSDEVLRSVVRAGLPEPGSVEASSQAMTPGGVYLPPRDLPKRARGRLYCHARLEFEQPVTGPVLVGAGRYFGVGLFAPEPELRTERGGPRDDADA